MCLYWRDRLGAIQLVLCVYLNQMLPYVLRVVNLAMQSISVGCRMRTATATWSFVTVYMLQTCDQLQYYHSNIHPLCWGT